MRKNVSGDQTPPSMLRGTVSSQATIFVAGDVGVMFFLLRMAFWLSVVLILLPTGSSQPQPCTVGSHVATELGYKAQAGAKMLYEFLTSSMASKDMGAKSTGSIGPHFGKADKPTMDQAAFNRASQNTLNASDMAPAWRGPVSRKDNKRAI